MKINQVFIKKYGSLINDKDYRFKPGFNLVYGLNEQGKSLTFDALVKLLLGKSSKKFAAINRVEDDPGQYGGFVELEIGQGQETETKKLQGKPNLTDLLGLTADECQNLFFVRNSDLNIGSDWAEQDKFYTHLTDRLTGLKAQEILLVKKQLRDTAQITDKTDQFQNNQENFQLGERLKQAEELLAQEGKVARLIAQDKKERWAEMENRALLLRQTLTSTQQQLQDLAVAQKIEEHQALSEKLQQIKKLLEELEPLSTITQTKLDELRSLEQTLNSLQETESELKIELKEKNQEQADLEKQLTKLNRQIKQLNQAQQEVDNQIQPELVQFAKKSAEVTAQSGKPWQMGSIISSVLLIAAFVTYLVQPSLLISILLAVLFVSTLVTTVKYFLHLQQKTRLNSRLEEIKLELAKYGIEGQQVSEIIKKVQDFRQNYQQLTQEQSSLTAQQQQLSKSISQLKDQKLSIIKDKTSQAQEKIEQIKFTCEVDTLQALKQKLEQKQKIDGRLQRLAVLVTEKLGEAEASQQGLGFWQAQLKKTRPLPTQAPNLQYDDKLEAKLLNKQQKNESELEEIKQKLGTFKTQLQELQRELNQVLKDRPEQLICETMSDLPEAKKELEQFIQAHHQNRKDALAVINLLEKIEQQEKEKVSQLFGPDSAISNYFSAITQHKYDQVIFDQNQGQIMVRLAKDQQFYAADKLSAGGYDQLYFAIRLGLGQKLLGEESGFFILDDPFLKSDHQRLKKQLDMLLNFSKQGWQIIYFSAKNEVKAFVEKEAEQVITVKL